MRRRSDFTRGDCEKLECRQGEALKHEQDAAEERARVNREKEAQHREIKANDERVSMMELKFKDETSRMKNDFACKRGVKDTK